MNQRSGSQRSDEIDKIEQLKSENFYLKRELSTFKSENHKLKVKVRKLHDDLNKRQKQIYNLVDPNKSSAVRKFIAEHGASLFLNLREQKEQLIKALLEKDTHIKKLQAELQTTKLYINERRKLCSEYQQRSKSSIGLDKAKEGRFKSSSLSEFQKNNYMRQDLRPKSSLEIKNPTENTDLEQLSNNLHTIKINTFAKLAGLENFKRKLDSQSSYSTQNSKDQSPYSSREPSPIGSLRRTSLHLHESASPRQLSPIRINNSPQSDIDRIEVGCESPHEEIQQLQSYFLEMLDEVSNLRNTIQQLQKDQKNTTSVLKNKEEYIEELAEEISSLKAKSLVFNSPRPTKKKRGKKPNDTKSTGSLSSCLKLQKHKGTANQDLKSYLYKGRYHNAEYEPDFEINTAVAKHSKQFDLTQSSNTKDKVS